MSEEETPRPNLTQEEIAEYLAKVMPPFQAIPNGPGRPEDVPAFPVITPRPVLEVFFQPLYDTAIWLRKDKSIRFFGEPLGTTGRSGKVKTSSDTNMLRAFAVPTPQTFDLYGLVGFGAHLRHQDELQWLRENSYTRLHIGTKDYLQLPSECVIRSGRPPFNDAPYVMGVTSEARDAVCEGAAEQERLREKAEKLREEADKAFLESGYVPLGLKKNPGDEHDLSPGSGKEKTREAVENHELALHIPSEQVFFVEVNLTADPPRYLIDICDPPHLRMVLVGLHKREIY